MIRQIRKIILIIGFLFFARSMLANSFEFLFPNIFDLKLPFGDKQEREHLAVYRGFISEGSRLKERCSSKDIPLKYKNVWDSKQVKRAIFSTLQYIGIDYTIKALAVYAQEFDFTEEEHVQLGENLIGNYCSVNISSISSKVIREKWMTAFKEASFKLPTVFGNELFPKALSISRKSLSDDERKKEFFLTLELFKSFCSWGNDVDHLRLLIPFVKHPVVASFVYRQIAGLKLGWNDGTNEIFYLLDPSAMGMVCKDFICRKGNLKNAYQEMPIPIVPEGVLGDLERLYCKDLRDVDYRVTGETPPKIVEKIKERTPTLDNLMVSQFIALVTGVPDFLIRSSEFADLNEVMRSPMDQMWSRWSRRQGEVFEKKLFYEEYLTMEVVDRKFYYNRMERKFKIIFEINFGEFDRISQLLGKPGIVIPMKLHKQIFTWVQKRVNSNKDHRRMDQVYKILQGAIEKEIKKAQEHLLIPVSSSKWSEIIAKELVQQISLLLVPLWPSEETGTVAVPIEIRYAPYALKYLYDNYRQRRHQENVQVKRVDAP